jgi:2'-5' RNA ligase
MAFWIGAALMAKIAADIVLLPSQEMTDRAIEANRGLLGQSAGKIVLNNGDCLPHISLAMGCIDEGDIAGIEKILQTIAQACSLEHLRVVGIRTEVNPAGEKVSAFQIERTETLQSLHEEIMRRLAPYLSYDVTPDMVFSGTADESTLLWIRNYPGNSSFKRFSPHITIGYGQVNDSSCPAKFTVSKLALCHLGNHCTCRKVLTSARLKWRA